MLKTTKTCQILYWSLKRHEMKVVKNRLGFNLFEIPWAGAAYVLVNSLTTNCNQHNFVFTDLGQKRISFQFSSK